MSKRTATASTIQITATTPVLMLALELGEEAWKLGFSSAFGQIPLMRDVGSRDTKALLAQIAWAKKRLGPTSRAASATTTVRGRGSAPLSASRCRCLCAFSTITIELSTMTPIAMRCRRGS